MRSTIIGLLLAAAATAVVVKMPAHKSPSLRARLLKEDRWFEVIQQKAIYNSNAASASQPFIDYADDFYLGAVGLGTPYQNFTVVLDTGSSNLWVIDAKCTTQACKGYDDSGFVKHQFNTDASSTFVPTSQTFSISYGSGSCSGKIATDRMNLAGLVYDTQGMGVSTTIADVFGHQPIDGILGLGWPALAVDKVTPPVFNLQDQLDAPIFTVWMDRHVRPDTGKSDGGLITYGALDNEHCEAQVDYVTLSSKTYWQFPLAGFSHGSYSLKQTKQAISDTGTSWMGMPTAVVQAVAKNIGAAYHPLQGLYQVSCTGKYDDMILTIGGKTYNIPSTEYIIDLDLGNNQCAVTMFSMSSIGFGPDFILGDTFIRSFCNVHDFGKGQIGFATAHHKEI